MGVRQSEEKKSITSTMPREIQPGNGRIAFIGPHVPVYY